LHVDTPRLAHLVTAVQASLVRFRRLTPGASL
jgi:hypothetical protein